MINPQQITWKTPTTTGHLLGGRVHYAQPRQGFRSGIEPVLLAAWSRPGQARRSRRRHWRRRDIALCLAARIPLRRRASRAGRQPRVAGTAERGGEPLVRPQLHGGRHAALPHRHVRSGCATHSGITPPPARLAGSGARPRRQARPIRRAPGSAAAPRRLRRHVDADFIPPATLLPACARRPPAGCPATAMLRYGSSPLPAKLGVAARRKGRQDTVRVPPGLAA